MPIVTPLKMGNKILLQIAEQVNDYNDESLNTIIQDMKDTMDYYKGVGIAAPQIGVSKRIIMYGFDKNPRYLNEKPVPFRILCNPEYIPLDNDQEEGWEGCLSVPGLRCLVSRFKNIAYKGYDFNKKEIVNIEASGFHARVIQHEIDHLDGMLFPFRTDNIKSLSFEDELNI